MRHVWECYYLCTCTFMIPHNEKTHLCKCKASLWSFRHRRRPLAGEHRPSPGKRPLDPVDPSDLCRNHRDPSYSDPVWPRHHRCSPSHLLTACARAERSCHPNALCVVELRRTGDAGRCRHTGHVQHWNV